MHLPSLVNNISSFVLNMCVSLYIACLAFDSSYLRLFMPVCVSRAHLQSFHEPLHLSYHLLALPLVFVDVSIFGAFFCNNLIHRLLEQPIEPEHELVVSEFKSLHSHLPVALQQLS